MLEVADGGTLFLDEVVDLHPEIQAKLLRVLEEKEFFPLGGTRKRHVDIRIVSASNQDLWKMTEAGKFRKDLYFRLATIRIDLPALRQRPEDILPLAQYFLEEFNDKYGKRFRNLSSEAEKLLLSHSWLGNVRELRNTLERVVLLENDTSVFGRHLRFLEEQTEKDDRPVSDALNWILPEEGMSLEEIEKKIILQAYEKCDRNKAKTARFLKLPRHVLIYRLKKHDIEK